MCSCRCGNETLLIARLIVGGIFIMSGWLKVSDMAATVGLFGQMGIPAFLAYAVSYLELIGGVLLVLGLFSCLVALVLSIIMIFAVWYTRSAGFQGFGLPLAMFAALLALIPSHGGRYSLDRVWGKGRRYVGSDAATANENNC